MANKQNNPLKTRFMPFRPPYGQIVRQESPRTQVVSRLPAHDRGPHPLAAALVRNVYQALTMIVLQEIDLRFMNEGRQC
jgi:hypothetical protein